MEKHVYFVRHGESDSNLDGVYRGRDSMLTETGRSQAQFVADRIAKVGVEALISSDFPRTLDTAAAIAERTGLEVEPSALFVEWLEPSANMERHREHPESLKIFNALFDTPNDPHARHSDEESFHALRERAEEAMRFLEAHPAKRICVVTHGAFLRVLAGSILFRDNYSKSNFLDIYLRLLTNNTGVTYVRHVREDRGWQVVSWNDSAHLG